MYSCNVQKYDLDFSKHVQGEKSDFFSRIFAKLLHAPCYIACDWQWIQQLAPLSKEFNISCFDWKNGSRT